MEEHPKLCPTNYPVGNPKNSKLSATKIFVFSQAPSSSKRERMNFLVRVDAQSANSMDLNLQFTSFAIEHTLCCSGTVYIFHSWNRTSIIVELKTCFTNVDGQLQSICSWTISTLRVKESNHPYYLFIFSKLIYVKEY